MKEKTEKLPQIKIIRDKGISRKLFIDGHEIKGVFSLQVNNLTTRGADATSIIVEIGEIQSLEIVEKETGNDINSNV